MHDERPDLGETLPEAPEAPVDSKASVSQNQTSEDHILRSFDVSQSSNQNSIAMQNMKLYLLFGVIAIIAGVGTGFGAYRLQAKGQSGSLVRGNKNIQQVAGDSVKNGDVFGVEDSDTFKDSAEGYLEAGGLDGEGSHKLLRPGGESQTVYLTSSVTDLNALVGMEVKVSGETFKGQKAGWLMDVGRVEVVKINGEAPSEE